MITKENFDNFRTELSIKSKNGCDFIISASIIWFTISFVWSLGFSSYDKSVLTFIVGSLMLPMAFLMSKILGTTWTNRDNPMQGLGLWLNFAQLLYFPFLIFTLIKMTDYFVMVYVIITGGHFFPYAWFFRTKWYAIFSVIIVVGALLLGLNLTVDKFHYIPLMMGSSLILLAILLYLDAQNKLRAQKTRFL
jgi:hypothetical protein